jgi:hypothetical protein
MPQLDQRRGARHIRVLMPCGHHGAHGWRCSNYFHVADDPETGEKTSGAVRQLRELRNDWGRLEESLLIVTGVTNEMKSRKSDYPEVNSFALAPVLV